MTQINIIGQILGVSGYDIHTRNLANALAKITDVRLSVPVPQGAERLLTDREIEMIKRKPQKDEINLIITLPIYWKLHTYAKRNWAYCIWEGDKVPKCFIEEFLNSEIEYILVASEHTKSAIENTINFEIEGDEFGDGNKEYAIIMSKVRIIPHGINLDLFYPKQTDEPNKPFRFLCNKGWRNLEDRGGIQYAIRAFLEEFTNKENVEMLVKINPAYGVPNIMKMLEELKPKDRNDLPNLKFTSNVIPYEKLVDLYNTSEVFVMPTRAEAFGIPGIEAMACGLSVITTNFGGQIDYCNDKNSWLIGGELTEVKHELQYESIKWLTPSIKELREKMRYAYEHQDEVKQKGKEALDTAKKFQWRHSAEKIKELI